MKKTVSRWFAGVPLALTAALASGCASEAPVASGGATVSARSGPAVAHASNGNRLPDLAGCERLAAPAGSTLVLRAFAIGVQIYRWNGASWGFVSPSATLYADATGRGQDRHSLRRSDLAEQQWWQGGRRRRRSLHSKRGVDSVAFARRGSRWSRHFFEGGVHSAAEHRRRQRSFYAWECRGRGSARAVHGRLPLLPGAVILPHEEVAMTSAL